MEHRVAVNLIKDGVVSRHPVRWADLGAGTGVFTKALAELLSHPENVIYAVDSDADALDQRTPTDNKATIINLHVDFVSGELPFHNLDGILMANSLHFVKDKTAFIQKLKKLIKSGGVLIVVEYDTAIPSKWVPYPIDFSQLREFMTDNGFAMVTKLGESPSMYQAQGLYAALVRPIVL